MPIYRSAHFVGMLKVHPTGRYVAFVEKTGTRAIPWRASAQKDGTLLFWSVFGELAHVVDGRIHLYDLTAFDEFRGAAVADEALYVSGTVAMVRQRFEDQSSRDCSEESRLLRPRSVSSGVVLLVGFLLAGCANGPEVLGPEDIGPKDIQVVFRTQGARVSALAISPDEAIFVATATTIYRNQEADEDRWAAVAPMSEFVTRLYAPSANLLYALTRSGRVFRWRDTDGITELPPPTAAMQVDGVLAGLGGPGPEELYVSGDGGTVLRFNGSSWEREPNPLERFAKEAAPTFYHGMLWSINGNADTVVALGSRVILKSDGTWKEIDELSLRHSYMAVAVTPGRILIGGDRSIYSLDGQPRKVLELDGFSRPIFNGLGQMDGQALFWNTTGDLAVLGGNIARIYNLETLGDLRGAAARGDFLYVAVMWDMGGMVAKFESR